MNANWTLIAAVSGILTGVSFLSICVSLALVAARWEALDHRRSMLLFALFVLFAGVSRFLLLTDKNAFQVGWNLATAVLSVVAATIVIARLPQYIKMPKIDGIEVLKHAHRVSPASAVVLITAKRSGTPCGPPSSTKGCGAVLMRC